MVDALSHAEQLLIRKVKSRDTAASTTFQDSSSRAEASASFQVSFESSSENDSVSAASSASLETRALELKPRSQAFSEKLDLFAKLKWSWSQLFET